MEPPPLTPPPATSLTRQRAIQSPLYFHHMALLWLWWQGSQAIPLLVELQALSSPHP